MNLTVIENFQFNNLSFRFLYFEVILSILAMTGDEKLILKEWVKEKLSNILQFEIEDSLAEYDFQIEFLTYLSKLMRI